MKIIEAQHKNSAATNHIQKKQKPFFKKEGQGDFFAKSNDNSDSFFDSNTIQTKLTIGQPNDKYEVEADTMADKIVQRLAHPNVKDAEQTAVSETILHGRNQIEKLGNNILQQKPIFESKIEQSDVELQTKLSPPLIQKKCNQCEEKEKLQKKEDQGIEEEGLGIQQQPIFEHKAEQSKVTRQAELQQLNKGKENNISTTQNTSTDIQTKSLINTSVTEEKFQKKEEELLETNEEIQAKLSATEVPLPPDDESVQTKSNDSVTKVSSNLQSRLNSSKGGGSAMGSEIKTSMGSAFGTDFNDVKIHTGSEAVQMSDELGAQAFTHGNDIYFNEGKYNTNSTSGKHLLAHELTHTIQQGKGKSIQPKLTTTKNDIQLDPGKTKTPGSSQNSSMKLGDVELHLWGDLGLIGISLYGTPWVQIKWDPSQAIKPSRMDVKEMELPKKIGIKIDAYQDIEVTINREVEKRYADLFPGGVEIMHSYKAKGKKVSVNKHLEVIGNTIGNGLTPPLGNEGEQYTEINKYQGQTIDGIRWNPEYTPEIPDIPKPGSLVDSTPITDFYWLFDTLNQLKAFVKAWPIYNWVAKADEKGKWMALHVNEKGMQKLANETRQLPEPLFTKMYINGEEKDSWLIYDLFYSTKWGARYGTSGDTEECFVFKHSDNSYGRIALEHAIAEAEWLVLDNTSTMDAYFKIVGGYFFEALYVKGTSGRIHEIDFDYLEARDLLFSKVGQKREDDENSYMPFSSSFGWDEIVTDNIWNSYLKPAVDRSEAYFPTVLRTLMKENSGLTDVVGTKILKDVERDAKWVARYTIEASIKGIKIYTYEESVKRLIVRMMSMTEKERNETLDFIGISGVFKLLWNIVLSDPSMTVRVWMGEDIAGVSIKAIIEKTKAQVKEFNKFLFAIEANEISPLYMEGSFGNEIRKIVYKKHGFLLSPFSFPHEGAAGGVSKGFGSEAAVLFAKAAAADAKRKRRNKYLKIFAVVVVSVALILVAGAAGAAVAGLLVSSTATAGGLVAFTLIELGVTAGIMTLVGPGVHTLIMSGGTASAEDYQLAYDNLGEQFVINFLTFGFFKGLGAATRALAVSGAGGKQAFATSRAWKAVDVGLRVTTTGGAFLGIGILSNYIKTGKIPEGEAMNELLFETAVSIALLEAGAFAVRGPMEQLQKWTRAKRLGEFDGRMNKLLVEANKLSKLAAEFSVRPNAAEKEGINLVARQKSLLISQKALVAEMSKSFRTRPDAKHLEFRLKSMQKKFDLYINQLKDIEFFSKAKIRPTGRLTNEEALFTYERGQEKEIIEYYGEKNVSSLGNGVMEVMQNGQKLIFKPATGLDVTLLPDGTRKADVKETWRSELTKRKMKLLEKAFDLAETNTKLKNIEKGEPSKMTDKELAKYEKSLTAAEKSIEAKSKLKTTVDVKKTAQAPGETTEAWRLRLVDIKENIIKRAELLGYEDTVAYMKSLPTKRSGLVKETLLKHKEAIDNARNRVEEQWGAKFEQEKTRQSLQPEKDVSDLKEGLKLRQDRLKRRAKIFGSSTSQYIKKATKSLGGFKKLSSLREVEALIEKAELTLDKRSAEALKLGIEKFGKETIDQARKGELAGMSDIQVGDALRMLRNAESLSAEAIRGALYASMGPPGKSTAKTAVPIEKAVQYAKSEAELNFVLESFLAINEAGIEGSYQLIRDAATSKGKWKGAVWQLELIRIVIGTQKVASVEVKVPGREIDILLKDGRRVEAKDWSVWYKEKFVKQFRADLEGATAGGTNPKGIKDVIWMFRDPTPVKRSEILMEMKNTLESFIADKIAEGTLTTIQAKQLRDTFKMHNEILTVPQIDASHVAPTKPGTNRPPMPPVIDDQDDK